MREYLTCPRGLLAGEVVALEGEEYRVRGFGPAVPSLSRMAR
jgi:hypothetical protein